jgi:hypothetical protein
LEENGTVLVKGTHYRGYAWDGCSPKFKMKDIYLGSFEGVLNFDTWQSKTYYASLIHDAFYQFNKELRDFIKRKEVDREFYAILKRDNFKLAKLYYLTVRVFGWLYWHKQDLIWKIS